MAYTMHEWQAREGTGLSKFTDTISGQVFNFESTPDSISVDGTPVSPVWLNEMEQGIYDGNTLVLTTDPTTSTVGTVGQFAINTVNNNVYLCTAASGTTYTWVLYSAFVIGDTLTTARTDLDDNWLLCNGATVQSADYPFLSALMPGLQNGIYSSLEMDFGSTISYGPYDMATDGNGTYVGTCGEGYIVYTTDINASSPVWTPKGIAGSAQLNGVCYGNGYWVVVGNSSSGRYATSPNGNWRPISLGSNITFKAVCYGNGYWVAIGQNRNLYYVSGTPDGSWTNASSNLSSSNYCYSIAYGNGFFVIGMENGDIAYAQTPEDVFTIKQIALTTEDIYGIYFCDGYWIAITSKNTMYTATSPDGQWTQNTSAPSMSSSTLQHRTVISNNGIFLGISTSGTSGANQLACTTDPTGAWNTITTVGSPSYIAGANDTYVAGKYRIIDDLIGLPQISLDKTYTYIKAK